MDHAGTPSHAWCCPKPWQPGHLRCGRVFFNMLFVLHFRCCLQTVCKLKCFVTHYHTSTGTSRSYRGVSGGEGLRGLKHSSLWGGSRKMTKFEVFSPWLWWSSSQPHEMLRLEMRTPFGPVLASGYALELWVYW